MIKKVLNIIKLALQMMLVMIMGFVISLGISVSVFESTKMPSFSELKRLDNVSDDLDFKEKSATVASRESILLVLSSSATYNGYAKMSGTYVTHKDKFYVLTAAHGIVGGCNFMFVATSKNNIYECIKYIIVDYETDYAIIEIEKVNKRIPLKLTQVLPSNRQWKQETSILNKVFYTGYPNSLGPLTFEGSVAGLSEENYLYLHSYAWPGSSGSGIFSYDGNLVGILIALNVGFTGAGYDVLEDLVIVTPLFMIDWNTAYEIMEEPSPPRDTGDTGDSGE
tara:strand:+ start:814 stop:1653 length:840 start_codon:yes stop_codon:yes gene_type:complete